MRAGLFVMILFHSIYCDYYLYEMNKDNQIENVKFQLDLEKYIDDFSFSYGLWSKYLPLGQISQIGKFGIFDNNCFHLHSATNTQTEEVIFLYSDCLDYKLQTIKKSVQFISDDYQYHNFDIYIDKNNYENVWFYFQIVAWPQYSYFELLILQQPETTTKNVLQIRYPYNTNNVDLTFGGGLYLETLQFLQNDNSNQKFAYYPGKFYLSPLDEISRSFLDYDSISLALTGLQDIKQCICNSNLNSKFNKDQILTEFKQEYFTSETENCDSFGLSGWLRIKEIHNINDKFDYKFMKMNKFSQNKRLNDDNLSSFQLLYRISSQNQYKIIIMSYSYKFPSVNIDFINNDFLITKEIEIQNDIYLWHYLSVTLFNNVLQINITFYKQEDTYTYQEQLNVYHFNEVQFQIHYGNINQQSQNYLNIQIENFNFYNCDTTTLINKHCHPSCQLCDGPTNSDCLSCSNNSNRLYIPQQKACVCHYNTIDQDYCYSNQNFKFQIIQQTKTTTNQIQQCQYGYFQLNQQTCIQCPSIIKSNLITCLECIFNPINWIYNPYCQTLLYIIEDNTFNTIQQDSKQYYIFIHDQIQMCEYCTFQQLQNESALYNNYIKQINEKQKLCQRNELFYDLPDIVECYRCNLDACLQCAVSETGLVCILCLDNLIVYNGQCKSIGHPNNNVGQSLSVKNKCLSPFYITSTKGCKLCQIKDCKYCFEYKKNDLKKCTLYDNFEIFEEDEFLSVGCSLCEDNFIFDFTVGLCLHQTPNLQFCVRSFINLDGIEICTLSSLDDFRVASEIINCEKLIINCLQCVLISQLQIKCVVCAQGYTSSVTTGQCYITPYNNSKISIEGDGFQMNGWIQLIQSFLMSFLPNQYHYPKPFSHLIAPLPIVCVDGYQISKNNTCQSYCPQDCLSCEETEDINFIFQCKKCSLDYYRLPLRSKFENKCLQCSPLCSICQSRNISEINQLNKHFNITNSNIIYTHKCLYPAPDPNIIIRQPQLIPQYCFSQNCSEFFQFEFEINEDTVQSYLTSLIPQYFYESNINTDYLNQNGIRIIKIKFLYLLPQEQQQNINDYQMIEIESILKQKIFSLTQVRFNLRQADILNNLFNLSLVTNGFDAIEIQNMMFTINQNFYFKFENDGSIEVDFENILFQGSQENQQYLQFYMDAKEYNNLRLINITYNNLWINNSVIWDVSFKELGGLVEISHIHFINCSFINSSIFQFIGNMSQIQILDITFFKCAFLRSSAFNFYVDYQINLDISILQLNVQDSVFQQSNLISNYQTQRLYIKETLIMQSNFTFSNIIISNFQLKLIELEFRFNLLQNSFFFKSQQTTQENQLEINFIGTQFNNNEFKNSSIADISSYIQSNTFQIYFNNTILKKNINTLYSKLDSFLFNIHSQTLKIFDLQIIDCFNLQFFNLYYIKQIYFDEIQLINSVQINKISLNIECMNFQILNQMFVKIQGVEQLTLKNIYVQNYFFVDQTCIFIMSETQHYQDFQEQIYLYNLTFTQNILLKQNTGNIYTFLAISSSHQQNIEMHDINFTQNILHQYTNDLSQSSSGLTIIDSYLSRVQISNFYSSQNIFVNSSNTFQYINSNVTLISNIFISNLNILSNYLLEKYYNIQFQEQIKEELIKLVSQQLLTIQNKVGVLKLTTSMFILNNGEFDNILSQDCALFEITTKDLGIVSITNIIVKNVEADLIQDQGIYGCITVLAKSSALKFEVTNASFINVFNKFGSSIFTILPSTTYNKIEIKNIVFQNCLSFVNQIIKLEFVKQKIEQNFVSLHNITIIQNLNAWIDFFLNIGPLSYQEVSKLQGDNAIINLVNCHVKIVQFQIEGYIISSVLKILDCYKVQFSQGNFYNISILFPFHLIYIGQDISEQIMIALSQINIQSISFSQNVKDIEFKKSLFFFQNINLQCSPIYQVMIQDQYFNLQNIIEQISENNIPVDSLISFFSFTNQSKFELKSIIISNNDCIKCEQGIINFNIKNFKQIKIANLLCYQNNIQKKGCIAFSSNSTLQNFAIIKNSYFIDNYGGQGSGIISNNINLIISKCIFLKNNASSNGGAIYIESNLNQIKFFETFIVQNEAKVGGGIYLDGYNSLNENNFIRSMLQLNIAIENSNNLVEVPDHLGLSVNNQEMNFYQNEENGIITNQLQLNEYLTISQGKKLKINHLMIPSNQKIGNYFLYDPFKLKYVEQIKEISISLRNQMNELITNVSDQICEISQSIVSKVGDLSKEQQLVSKLSYNNQNNRFDLGNYIFQLDPYQDQNTLLKIQIDCIVESSYKRLRYIIYAKSYLCQLGEYYVDKGCQKCSSIQGYYSVTYNTTKCSIFDNSKFQNITSNQINLNPGYWRPNYLSDSTEQCFKNLFFCKGGWEVGDNLCLQGHIGGLCEECDIYNIKGYGQYFKNQSNQQCNICPKESINLIPFIFVSLWSILSILLSVRSIEKTNQLYSSLSFKQKFRRIIFKLNQDHQSFLIKMLLNYLWIFSVIFSFNIEFTISITFFESASNSSFVLANSLDCYLSKSEFEQMIELKYLRIVTMLILIVVQLLLFCFGFKLHSMFNDQQLRTSIITNIILYLYLQNNASLIKQFISLLAKRQISNVDFIQGDVSSIFDLPSHYKWIFTFLLPGVIFVGCGIPILLFLLMYLKKDKLENIKLRRHIGYLFNEYNQSSYFWEYIKILKKTVIIVIIVYFETNLFLKASLLGICLLFYQSLAENQQPLVLKSLNKLDIQTCQICSLTIFLAVVQYISQQNNNQIYSVILQIFIILLWIRLFYSFTFKILITYWKKYKIDILTFILQNIQKIVPNSKFSRYLENNISIWKIKNAQILKNYNKLKLYLLSLSKVQIENQKQQLNSYLSPISSYRTKILSQENEKIILI